MTLHPFHSLGSVLCALGALGIAGALPAAAQFDARPPLPSGFRPLSISPQPQAAPMPAPAPVAAPKRPAAAPVAKAAPKAAPKSAPRTVASMSSSPEPTYDEGTRERMVGALQRYSLIEAGGGWPTVQASVKFVPGGSGPEVVLLRQRLAVTGDIAPNLAAGEQYDDAVVAAVKRFQTRHGLPATGAVATQTIAAMNVPVRDRMRALQSSLDRLSQTSFNFGQRYVAVNIPAAWIEAVANGRVEKRYVAVVGKPDRASPLVTSVITVVNVNPTWTVPLSIVKKDIVPKMRKDPSYLARMHIRLLDGAGNEINPATVDWSSGKVPNYTMRQDPGPWNALGVVRIDMPNSYSVYMHDTNHKEFFSADYRFQSSGCVRVSDPRDLAAWVLKETPGWGRAELDAAIASGARRDVRLAHAVPVAWVYLTGWASRDGTINFRNDVYKLDDAPARPFMVSLPKPVVSAARASGFSLQSDESRPAMLTADASGALPALHPAAEDAPAELHEVSFLDSQ